MTSYEVRRAEVADAVRLAEVHVQMWRQAYAEVMPAEYLAGLDAARNVEMWRRRLLDPTPGAVVLVATAAEELVGMSTAGPSRDDPPEPPHELYAINVLAAHHGTGVAGQLFASALDATGADAAVSLWVLDVNARARAFYARYGFEPDGRTKGHEGTGVKEVRLVRPAR